MLFIAIALFKAITLFKLRDALNPYHFRRKTVFSSTLAGYSDTNSDR